MPSSPSLGLTTPCRPLLCMDALLAPLGLWTTPTLAVNSFLIPPRLLTFYSVLLLLHFSPSLLNCSYWPSWSYLMTWGMNFSESKGKETSLYQYGYLPRSCVHIQLWAAFNGSVSLFCFLILVLYQFARTSVIKHHKLSGLNSRNVLSYGFGSQKSEIKAFAGPWSLWRY